jgi:hypothetical protein
MPRKQNILKSVREFAEANDYFSISQMKKFLTRRKIRYSELTVKQYLGALTQDKKIFDAGRGYYSTIKDELELDHKSLDELVQLLVFKFPFLRSSLWSTKQLNFAFHHQQTKFVTFIYADRDSHEYIRNYLEEKDYNVYVNPQKKDKMRNFRLNLQTVILRPYMVRGTPKGYFSSLEKILVDFFIENRRLDIIDGQEYERIFDYLITNFRIQIGVLIDYAKRRKVKSGMERLIQKYTNVTF